MTYDFDQILKMRKIPEKSSFFQQKIIESAHKKNAPAFMDELKIFFVFQRPALIFGLSIVLGLVIGFQSTFITSSIGSFEVSQNDFITYITVEDGELL